MITGAVDPGKTGALAVVNELGDVETADMPLTDEGIVDGAAVLRFFIERDVEIVIMERVHALPHDGKVSAFNFGFTNGVLRGVAQCMGLPHKLTTPQTWKRALGLLKADKSASRELAMKMFPRAADQFKRVKDHSRAEAALLAAWHLGMHLKEAA
jgi:crossover junction endodeoxyribonuclease RuvC